MILDYHNNYQHSISVYNNETGVIIFLRRFPYRQLWKYRAYWTAMAECEKLYNLKLTQILRQAKEYQAKLRCKKHLLKRLRVFMVKQYLRSELSKLFAEKRLTDQQNSKDLFKLLAEFSRQDCRLKYTMIDSDDDFEDSYRELALFTARFVREKYYYFPAQARQHRREMTQLPVYKRVAKEKRAKRRELRRKTLCGLFKKQNRVATKASTQDYLERVRTKHFNRVRNTTSGWVVRLIPQFQRSYVGLNRAFLNMEPREPYQEELLNAWDVYNMRLYGLRQYHFR